MRGNGDWHVQVRPHLRGDAEVELLHELQDVVLLDEAHLQVELRELRLPVRAQVLVAVAAGDLEVALESGHHQQLLELLRRLRQGVEAARVDAAGHQVVARTLRRRVGQHGRLDLDELAVRQELSDVGDDPVAHDDVVVQPLAPEVQVAVLEPRRLADLRVLVDVEGRRLGGVEHGGLGGAHLDGAGGHLVVLGALAAPLHRPAHLQHVLAARLAGDGVGSGLLRVEDHLHDAAGVSQVDEDEAAVVAAAVHPAGQCHVLALVFGAQVAAVVSLQHVPSCASRRVRRVAQCNRLG